MPHFWVALALFIVLPAIGAVVAFRRGLALWRDLKRATKGLTAGLDGVSRRAEVTAARAGGVGETTSRVEPSVARLQLSLARLSVLRGAVQDVQNAVGRVTAVYPRK